MTWNLWNVVRHYAYIKFFKNRNRQLGSDKSAWDELEQRTKKLMKGIYRTYMQKKKQSTQASDEFTFGNIDRSSTNVGQPCLIKWTNSFVEISSILERNAREHESSFVLFTGNNGNVVGKGDYGANENYEYIRSHKDNFAITTLDGLDSDETGMRPRKKSDKSDESWIGSEDDIKNTSEHHVYQGHLNSELPISYVIGDTTTYSSNQGDIDVSFDSTLNLDSEYPYSEYYRNDATRKWVRTMNHVVMNRQIIPVYTSMETMDLDEDVHSVTVDELKSITFQTIPQFYWKYEWSYNDFMIHPVGSLNPHSDEFPIYDMLGNVWEWVRDDWTEKVNELDGKVNPIAVSNNPTKKVIKGGAFDQLVRKTISSSREGLDWDKFQSKFGTQANVGFRPSMVYVDEKSLGGFNFGNTPVDLFFLFDASSS